MESPGRDWRSILLSVLSLGSALTAFTLAALMFLYTAVRAFTHMVTREGPTPLEATMLASAIALAGALFLPAAYYSIQRLRGKIVPELTLRPLKVWQGALLLLLWVADALLAQVLFNNEALQWLTPPLYLLAIGVPVYFLARLAAGGLHAGSQQRVWGVLSISMALGISFSTLAEAAVVLLALIGVGMYIGLHPNLIPALGRITNRLTNSSDVDEVLSVIGPWLNSPTALLLALLFFSGFAPLIEEPAKSIATWSVFSRFESPAQGFVLGALSGAGFGLLESLLASATPDPSWASTLLVRGGSTMMHVLTASLTGWGIASFRLSKRLGGLVGMYALAMFLHSLWNASVMVIVFGSLRSTLHAGGPEAWGAIMAFTGLSILVMLCVAIPLALGLINWKLRTAPSRPSPIFSAENMGEGGRGPGGGSEGVQ